MRTPKIDIKISGDAVEGYVLEDAYRYDNMELRYLLSWLPKAIRAIKKELRCRRIEKRCREIESKPTMTWREAVWYAFNSGRVVTSDKHDLDELEWFEEIDCEDETGIVPVIIRSEDNT